jgi:hypothetical protein
MACDIWLRRDYLIRCGREPEEPPCGHDPQQCPPPIEGANPVIDLPDPLTLADVHVEYHDHHWVWRHSRACYECIHVNADGAPCGWVTNGLSWPQGKGMHIVARAPLGSRSPVQAAETVARIAGAQAKTPPLDVAAFQSFAD